MANVTFLESSFGGVGQSHTIACDGDVNNDGFADVIIGAPFEVGMHGKVYVFFGNTTNNLETPVDLTRANASFTGESNYDAGRTIAYAGDVNNDGYDDFLTSNPYYGMEWGKIYLIYGNATENFTGDFSLSQVKQAFYGQVENCHAGTSLAGIGDVNNDGYDDFLIGAQDFNGGQGQVYLLFGRSGGFGIDSFLDHANGCFTGESLYDRAGSALAGVGDVNNDGYDDFLIGASKSSQGAGKSYLFYGNESSNFNRYMSLADANASFIGEHAYDAAGYACNKAGDVNDDGNADFLIGAYNNSDGGVQAGKTYLYYGNSTGILRPNMNLATANASFVGEHVYDASGYSVDSAGDVNHDGYTDFVIGSYNNSDGGYHAGKVYLYYGNKTGVLRPNMSLATANASFIGVGPSYLAGSSLAGAGDINGDGILDFLVGAQGAEEVYLICGSDVTPPASIPNLQAINPTTSGCTLTWTAPGDDGMEGNASNYVVKYSTSEITSDNFNTALSYDTSGWGSLAPNGTQESRPIVGLAENTTYYFAIKALDDWNNIAAISNDASISTLNIPPDAITDLRVTNVTTHSIVLEWTAPGDDDSSGTVAGYVLKYSSAMIDAASFDGASSWDTTGWALPAANGTREVHTLALPENTTYYFAIKARDEVPNYGGISNCEHNGTLNLGPAVITDLAIQNPSLDGFILSWTAPGNDEWNGTVAGYVLKYSTTPITAINFNLASTYPQSWANLVAGNQLEVRAITGFEPGMVYYFAIKARDEVPNWPAISNMVFGQTLTDTLLPAITSPGDFNFEVLSTGHNIGWTITDSTTRTPMYTIFRNGTPILANQTWVPGTPIVFSIDGLPEGHYGFTIVASDGYGNTVADLVEVVVSPHQAFPFDWVLYVALGAIAVLAGVIFKQHRRKGLPSTP